MPVISTADSIIATSTSSREKPVLFPVLIPVPVTLAHLQYEALLARVLRISGSRPAPEDFDHQGTGAVTMIASFNAVLWRRIMTDRSPGILDAIRQFYSPQSEIVVGLLFRCA